MGKKIIRINQETCNACGLCVSACHEGAMSIKDGRVLILQDYCDGLGACLPLCPAGAISFEEQGAEEPQGFQHDTEPSQGQESPKGNSHFIQWPIQIKLVPPRASYFKDADLLIAADCSAYTHPHFHTEFMRNRIILIGCPKLDNVDYSEKLTQIIRENHLKSLRVVRMEVPCCGGIEWAVMGALKNSGKHIPLEVVTLSTEGQTLGDG